MDCIWKTEAILIDESGNKKHIKTENLSVSGVLVITNEKPEVGTQFEMQIILPGSDGIMISLIVECVRHDEKGFAVNFVGVESEDYENLVKLVAYQNESPSEVFEQQVKKPGIK